jgi:hypothetical protein
VSILDVHAFRFLANYAVETIAFALSVIIVASMVQDGRSNYLEGAMVSDSRTTGLPMIYKRKNDSLTWETVAYGVLYHHCPGFLGKSAGLIGKTLGSRVAVWQFGKRFAAYICVLDCMIKSAELT